MYSWVKSWFVTDVLKYLNFAMFSKHFFSLSLCYDFALHSVSGTWTYMAYLFTFFFGRRRRRWENNIRRDLREILYKVGGLDAPGSGWEPVAGSCEHSNEPSGSIKGQTFLTSWATVGFSSRTLFQSVSQPVSQSVSQLASQPASLPACLPACLPASIQTYCKVSVFFHIMFSSSGLTSSA